MNRVIATAVGAALDQPPIVDTTVAITVRARAPADVPVAHLVVEALQEFIDACPDEAKGTFESKGGLDVAWSITHYQLPVLVASN